MDLFLEPHRVAHLFLVVRHHRLWNLYLDKEQWKLQNKLLLRRRQIKLKPISKMLRSFKLLLVDCSEESKLNRVQSPLCLVQVEAYLEHKQSQLVKEHCSNQLQVALLEANKLSKRQLPLAQFLLVLLSLPLRAVFSAILVKSRRLNPKKRQRKVVYLVTHHFPSQLDHSLALHPQVEEVSLEPAQLANQVVYLVLQQDQIFLHPNHCHSHKRKSRMIKKEVVMKMSRERSHPQLTSATTPKSNLRDKESTLKRVHTPKFST